MVFKFNLIFLFVCSFFVTFGERFFVIQNKIKLIFETSLHLKQNIICLFKDIKKKIMSIGKNKKFFSFWKQRKKKE